MEFEIGQRLAFAILIVAVAWVTARYIRENRKRMMMIDQEEIYERRQDRDYAREQQRSEQRQIAETATIGADCATPQGGLLSGSSRLNPNRLPW